MAMLAVENFDTSLCGINLFHPVPVDRFEISPEFEEDELARERRGTVEGDFKCQHLYEQLDADSQVACFKHLMKMYNFHANNGDTDSMVVFSGGLQQYLIKQSQKRAKPVVQQPRRGDGSDVTTFHDLPDSIQLKIFSYLDAKVLCQIATVCQHWDMLSCDDILWQRRLEQDIRKWGVIGHMTNPYMYKECKSDWSHKEIYLRCSPEVTSTMRLQNLNFHQLSSLLRSLWPRKAPKLAMFGPGLETTTSPIVRRIIQDKNGPFQAVGMFPGQFEGFGSGFTMKMESGLTFGLTALYTSNRHERENFRPGERLRHNRMLAQQRQPGGEGTEGEEPTYELRQPIKDLCQTLDAFVFVVDASQSPETISSGKPELVAMVNEMWSSPSIPLVILSCVPDLQSPRVPCIEIVQLLKLATLTRPWQVHDCVVESLGGVPEAITWVVQQSQRR